MKRLLAVISTLLYVILWLPAGLLSMLVADWLKRRPPEKSNWQPRSTRVNQSESLREPF